MVSFLVRLAGSGGKALLAGILVAAASKNRQVAITVGVVLGYLLSSALLSAPMFTFVEPTRKEKGGGARTAYRHIMTMFGCVVWTLFAIPSFHDNVFTVIVNGAGIILQLGYVCRFLYYAAMEACWLPLYFLLGALIVSVFLTALVVEMVILRGVWNARFIGVIASVVTGLASIFVIVDTVVVLKSRRASSNLYLLVQLLLSICNAATWTFCAFLSTPVDLYSGIPCAIGLGFLFVQLGVHLMYRTDDDDFGFELRAMFQSPV